MEFQGYIERLKTTFISDAYADEIKKAKQEFAAIGGDLGIEIDAAGDLLNIFFDWYLFDRPQSIEQQTPLQLLTNNLSISEEDKKIYSGFAENIHSIFVIKKNSGDIQVQDIFTPAAKSLLQRFTGNKYLVANTSSALLEKGDVTEARLLRFGGEYRFSGAFCFYPKNLYTIMKARVKEARKKGMQDFSPLIRRFRKLKAVWSSCARMDVKKIYTLMEEGRIA